MKFKESLGIDVSKLTIDAALYEAQVAAQFENNVKGFKKLIKWVKTKSETTLEETIICFEFTGNYSLSLSEFLSEREIQHSIVPGLEIKRSLGITRGKDDKTDAFRIAEYAFLRQNKLKAFEPASKEVKKLQRLISLRKQLVKDRASYKVRFKESKRVLVQKEHSVFLKINKDTIAFYNKRILEVEKEIKAIIAGHEKLKNMYKLLLSIPGVGFVFAVNFIVVTKAFTAFDDPRKFACYAGTAPFDHQSGTSVKGRKKVSSLANKNIKTLLNQVAISAARFDPQMKKYFERKIAEGKHLFCVRNNIRNKVIKRVFAVLHRNTPYVRIDMI